MFVSFAFTTGLPGSLQGLSPAIPAWPAGVTVGLGGNPIDQRKEWLMGGGDNKRREREIEKHVLRGRSY